MSYNALDFLTRLYEPDVMGLPEITSMPGIDDLEGDWRCWFEERAAIMEYDGGLPREHAESLALAETIRLMQK